MGMFKKEFKSRKAISRVREVEANIGKVFQRIERQKSWWKMFTKAKKNLQRGDLEKVSGKKIRKVMKADLASKLQKEEKRMKMRKKEENIQKMLQKKRKEAVKKLNYKTPVSKITEMALQIGKIETEYLSMIDAQTNEM